MSERAESREPSAETTAAPEMVTFTYAKGSPMAEMLADLESNPDLVPFLLDRWEFLVPPRGWAEVRDG